jgi:hypothetical protein
LETSGFSPDGQRVRSFIIEEAPFVSRCASDDGKVVLVVLAELRQAAKLRFMAARAKVELVAKVVTGAEGPA